MSQAAAPRPMDFRRPRRGAPPMPRAVGQWHERIGVLAAEAWSRYLQDRAAWAAAPAEVCTFAEAVNDLPDPGVGFSLQLAEPAMSTLWVFSQSHILGLVSDMLGTGDSAAEDPRPLSVIEESMAQLLIAELAWAIGEAWPGRESIPCRVGALDRRPSRSRLFAPRDMAYVWKFRLTSSSGAHDCLWLAPQDAVDTLVGTEWPADEPLEAATASSEHLEQLAGSLPLTLNVQLGSARLPMSQLANLQVGDVIILDQPINRPIVAEVGGTTRFTGFPGRIGSRQSFQVHEVVAG